jgi:hypothetical protein
MRLGCRNIDANLLVRDLWIYAICEDFRRAGGRIVDGDSAVVLGGDRDSGEEGVDG